MTLNVNYQIYYWDLTLYVILINWVRTLHLYWARYQLSHNYRDERQLTASAYFKMLCYNRYDGSDYLFVILNEDFLQLFYC